MNGSGKHEAKPTLGRRVFVSVIAAGLFWFCDLLRARRAKQRIDYGDWDIVLRCWYRDLALLVKTFTADNKSMCTPFDDKFPPPPYTAGA